MQYVETMMIAVACSLCVAACENELPTSDAALECTLDIGLQANASALSNGVVTIYGTSSAPQGISVQSIFVASQPVAQSQFNFRSFTVQIPLDVLRAYEQDGVATLPVIAYTSGGCSEIVPEDQPAVTLPVELDAGVTVPDVPDAGV